MLNLLEIMRDILTTNMVRTVVLGKLCMRKPKTKRAVLLDAVPERCTRQCSPRFRPGNRFYELSFRFLFPGREGENCRLLDHAIQIPFIHSVRFMITMSINIQQCSSYFLHVVRLSVAWWCACANCACALAQTLISMFRTAISVLFPSIRYVLILGSLSINDSKGNENVT